MYGEEKVCLGFKFGRVWLIDFVKGKKSFLIFCFVNEGIFW